MIVWGKLFHSCKKSKSLTNENGSFDCSREPWNRLAHLCFITNGAMRPCARQVLMRMEAEALRALPPLGLTTGWSRAACVAAGATWVPHLAQTSIPSPCHPHRSPCTTLPQRQRSDHVLLLEPSNDSPSLPFKSKMLYVLFLGQNI